MLRAASAGKTASAGLQPGSTRASAAHPGRQARGPSGLQGTLPCSLQRRIIKQHCCSCHFVVQDAALSVMQLALLGGCGRQGLQAFSTQSWGAKLMPLQCEAGWSGERVRKAPKACHAELVLSMGYIPSHKEACLPWAATKANRPTLPLMSSVGSCT